MSRDALDRVTGPMSTTTLAVGRPLAAALPIVLLVVAGWAVAFGLWWKTHASTTVRPTVPVIAVLPFANNSTPDDAPIAAGMRDVLIANLGAFKGINVLSKSATSEDGARPRRSEEARPGSRRHLSDRRKPAAIGQRSEGLGQSR